MKVYLHMIARHALHSVRTSEASFYHSSIGEATGTKKNIIFHYFCMDLYLKIIPKHVFLIDFQWISNIGSPSDIKISL